MVKSQAKANDRPPATHACVNVNRFDHQTVDQITIFLLSALNNLNKNLHRAINCGYRARMQIEAYPSTA